MGKKRESGKRSVDTLCALLSAACSLKERLTYKGALAFAHPYRSRRDNSRALHTRGAVRSDQRCLAVRGAGLPNDAYLANSASHQITHTQKKKHMCVERRGGMHPARIQSRAGTPFHRFSEKTGGRLSVTQRCNKEHLNSASRAGATKDDKNGRARLSP